MQKIKEKKEKRNLFSFLHDLYLTWVSLVVKAGMKEERLAFLGAFFICLGDFVGLLLCYGLFKILDLVVKRVM